MESKENKSRTSRCREWERQRRNKFNDALTKLGDIVKSILKSNNNTNNDTDTVQYPKIEIIQKAIICLTNCVQEKTQLKAEILALQVKIDAKENKKKDSKDASTQVIIEINKSRKNGKYVKLLMLQKSKRKRITKENKKINESAPKNVPTMKQLPKLLPMTNNVQKKAPENTIVVLPATPYIFPQRPMLFPSVPPAIVLVDSNLQTLNKPTVPIVCRNTGDITKTTMVNILPISAYSCPLSLTKSKKNNVKNKSQNKKAPKKTKSYIKSPNTSTKHDITPQGEPCVVTKQSDTNSKCAKNEIKTTKCDEVVNVTHSNVTEIKDNTPAPSIPVSVEPKINVDFNKIVIDKSTTEQTISEATNPPKNTEVPISVANHVNTEATVEDKCNAISTTPTKCIEIPKKTDDCFKIKPTEKDVLCVDKDNKLTNILETTLCDNVVDVGNARLELAEEFLAASPTAAFLMSFPLVSGNRADSPAEDQQNTVNTSSKDTIQRRNELPSHNTPTVQFFDKANNEDKVKTIASKPPLSADSSKQNEQEKYIDNVVTKQVDPKTSNASTIPNGNNENPFLNLSMPSLISTACTISDSSFGLDFDCNLSKTVSCQPSSFTSNSNIFYKSDPFGPVKSNIYSTSNIPSGHDINSLGLYPCAVEKYSKNKIDYTNMEDNLMKIGSSRLTYDIDLGWSHKSFDFVNCTTANATFNKDNILTTTTGPYCSTYTSFNPEFHVPLVSSATKKDNIIPKPSSSFADTITSFYSQPTNLWTEDFSLYSNNNVSKTLTSKHQNYLPLESAQSNLNVKQNIIKSYEPKQNSLTEMGNTIKPSNTTGTQQVTDKYPKKSSSKMHINWMTSEIRPMQNNFNPVNTEPKDLPKLPYTHLDHVSKKQDHNEGNYFPISMHNFPAQPSQDDFQMWPSARPLGTTEISIDPPPINLPTLVGDLALGPHDKKKQAEATIRQAQHTDIQNCSNFLSVTQLMNRSTDMSNRYQAPTTEASRQAPSKHNVAHYTNDANRKVMSSRIESHAPQPYVFNDTKIMNSYENMIQFPQSKSKTTNKSEKSSKSQKNNYSAEALLRGGNCTQKMPDSGVKFMMPQKYNEINAPQDSSVAQISHFPPILDYTENSYAGQQFSGTTLYNTTTNTISNSFYTNFRPGSSNLMSSNYTGGPFTGEFIDYNQATECNYTNHKYEELKMRNNPTTYQSDKGHSNYKSSRKEAATKHKLECSKKESTKKYQSKRAKLNEAEDWSDPSHLLWQNKGNKRHPSLMPEELPFPNYVTNQMPTQYQPDFFNSHLMPSNMQGVGHNADRSLGFPVTSRANFNLSTIFPEITMATKRKLVQ